MSAHACKDTYRRCQYEDDKGRLCCDYEGVIDERPDLCPICGEPAMPIAGRTRDGRVIGRCGDAFEWPEVSP